MSRTFPCDLVNFANSIGLSHRSGNDDAFWKRTRAFANPLFLFVFSFFRVFVILQWISYFPEFWLGHDGREKLVVEGIALSIKPSECIRRITKTRKNENTKRRK